MLKSKSILIPNISQKQQDLADKWWSEHSCIDKNSNFKDDCDIGSANLPIIKIIHNSIAANIYLYCPFCNEKYDASDYENW